MTSAVPLALFLSAGTGAPRAGEFSLVADYGPYRAGLSGEELEKTLDALDARKEDRGGQTAWVFRRPDGWRGELLLGRDGQLCQVLFEEDLSDPLEMRPLFAELEARYGKPTFDHPQRKTWRNGTVSFSAWWSWVGGGVVRASERWTGLPHLCGRGPGGPSCFAIGESWEEARGHLLSAGLSFQQTGSGEERLLTVAEPCQTVRGTFRQDRSGWVLDRIEVRPNDRVDRGGLAGRLDGADEWAGKPTEVSVAGGLQSYLWRGPEAAFRLTFRPTSRDRFSVEETWTRPGD